MSQHDADDLQTRVAKTLAIADHLIRIASGVESDEWLSRYPTIRTALAEGRFVDAVRENWKLDNPKHRPKWVASRDVKKRLDQALGTLAHDLGLPNIGRVEIRLDDFPATAEERGTIEQERLRLDQEQFERYSDPMEKDPRYAAAIAEVDKRVERKLADDPLNGGLGFCHVVWSLKKQILRDTYGIDWKSLADRFPDTFFD